MQIEPLQLFEDQLVEEIASIGVAADHYVANARRFQDALTPIE